MGRARGLWTALLAVGAVLGAPTFRDPYDCVEAAYGLATAGRNEEATKTFEVCARLGEQARLDGGTMAQIYFNLGQSYMQLGDLLRAKATFEKALVVNPRLDQALVKLAFIANEQGDAPATVSLLTRALALSPPGQPRDPSLLEYLADTLNNLKQFAKAVELYREALGSLKRAPLSVKRQREPELRLRLGDALVNLKKSSEAAEQFRYAPRIFRPLLFARTSSFFARTSQTPIADLLFNPTRRLGLQRAPRHQGLWASWFHNLIFRCDWGSLSNVSLALQSRCGS